MPLTLSTSSRASQMWIGNGLEHGSHAFCFLDVPQTQAFSRQPVTRLPFQPSYTKKEAHFQGERFQLASLCPSRLFPFNCSFVSLLSQHSSPIAPVCLQTQIVPGRVSMAKHRPGMLSRIPSNTNIMAFSLKIPLKSQYLSCGTWL